MSLGGATRLPSGLVGLLGGAFDPPHVGHVALAREAIEQLALRKLLVVVTGAAPHKHVATDPEIRFALAERAFAGLARAEVSRVELDRPGPSYTLDTVNWARKAHGDTVFVIGADEFAGFLDWHEPACVLEVAQLAVATRPGFGREQLEPVLEQLERRERVHFFAIPAFVVASSDIRRRVADGRSVDDLVPAPVGDEIRRLGLYRDGDGEQQVRSPGMSPSCEGS